MRLIHWIFRWLNAISIIFLMLAYLAPYVSANVFWPFAFIGIAYPFLLLLNALFVFYWLLLKRRFAIYSLIAILVGSGYIKTVVGFNLLKDRGETTNKVLSYNVNSLYANHPSQLKKGEKNPIIKFIKKEACDLSAMQELTLTKENRDLLKKHKIFKYEYLTNYLFYLGSNSPISEKGNIAISQRNGVVWIDTKLNGKTVRLYNVHLKSNRISNETNNFAFRKDLFTTKIFPYIKHVLVQIRKKSKIRANQAEELAKHIADCPHPVIVCGDFNEVPLSYPYRIISEGLKDAFEAKGTGFGFTYSGKFPGLRLDYILVSEELEVVDFEVGEVLLSDHYPVIAHLKVK